MRKLKAQDTYLFIVDDCVLSYVSVAKCFGRFGPRNKHGIRSLRPSRKVERGTYETMVWEERIREILRMFEKTQKLLYF